MCWPPWHPWPIYADSNTHSPDECSCWQPPREGGGQWEPGGHPRPAAAQHARDDPGRRGPGPGDGHRDRDNLGTIMWSDILWCWINVGSCRGCDEDPGEVVSPGQVQVHRPAEHAERHLANTYLNDWNFSWILPRERCRGQYTSFCSSEDVPINKRL